DAAFAAALDGASFAAPVTLAHGTNELHVVAALVGGARAEIVRRVVYRGTAPGLQWLAPAGGQPVGGPTVRASVRATASAGRTVSSVALDAGGATAAATAAGDVWSADVAL